MPAFDRGQVEGQTQPNQVQYEGLSGTERESHINRVPRGSMPPPPIPIDPALDSFNTSTVPLSPGIGLDHLLQPSPGLQERLGFSGTPTTHVVSFPQDVQLPSMKQNIDLATNPLYRFYNDPGPWTSQRIAGDMNQSSMFPRYQGAYGPINRLPVLPSQYRESPRSDFGSSTTGRNQHDSGYGTRSYTTKSVQSTEPIDQSQSCQSLSGDVGDMQIYPEENFQTQVPGHAQEVSYPFDIPNDAPGEQPALLICHVAECGIASKNQSEHRKHLLRHTRPYRCQEPNCPRKAGGFSTNNDLERHKKSVHKIAPKNTSDRSFRCVATNCPKKDKIWPRHDNFRQHCTRMHKNEDTDGLVRNSELNSGSLLSKDGFASGSKGLGIEQGDPNPPNYANLSTLNPKVAESDSKMSFHDTNIALSHITNDARFVPNGSFDQNGDLHQMGQVSSTQSIDQRCVSQLQMPPQMSADFLIQTPHVNGPSASRDSSREENDLNKANCRLNDQIASSLNIPIYQKAIKNKPTALKLKAEKVSQILASNVVNRLNTGSVEDIKLIIENGFMSLFDSDGARKRSSEDISSAEASDPKRKRVACDYCPKTMVRQCDLKKHKKRHTRPYGCTFSSCSKVFGSKNDWKRHENTQHYQIEAWRCHEASSNLIKQCAKVFYRRELFQTHLKDFHEIKDEDHIREKSRRQRIGRNGQSGFWCGFCKKIVKLEKKDLEAWDERFNHIDDFHFKKGERIDKWYPLDRDIPKGLLRNDNVLDSGVPSSVPEETESDEESSDSTEKNGSPESTQGNSPSLPTPNNEGAGADFPGRGSIRGRIWYCCHCSDGPQSALLNICCSSCAHRSCSTCDTRH